MTRSLAIALLTLALLPAASYGSNDGRNGRIAWSRITLDGSAIQIVTARPDGSDLRVLTPATEGASDLDPKSSPDGRRIVFDREFADGTVQIIIIDADGGESDTSTRVAPTPASPIRPRPGGRTAATSPSPA